MSSEGQKLKLVKQATKRFFACFEKNQVHVTQLIEFP